MATSSKFLVGALITVNLALVGLLLFRDRATPAVQAEATATGAVPAAVAAPAGEVAMPPVAVAESPALAPAAPAAVDRIAEQPTQAATIARQDREQPTQASEPSRPARRETQVSPPVEREPMQRQPAERQSTAPERVATQVPPAAEPWSVRTDDRRAELEGPGTTSSTEPVLRPRTVSLEAGTHVGIELDVALHSRQVRSGDRFDASLAGDLVVDGERLARAGDPVGGRITEVRDSGRVKGLEQMRLTLAELTLAGKTYPVRASTATYTAEDDRDRDTAVVAGSSIVGAIIGGIAKGGKGAATGAATGAAAGAGVILATKGKPVVLEPGTVLDFTLEDVVRVTLPGAPGNELERPERDRRSDEPAGVVRR